MSTGAAAEQALVVHLQEHFGEVVKPVWVRPNRVKLMVPVERMVEVAAETKNWGLDHCETVIGTDYPKESQIEVAYALASYGATERRKLVALLATRLPRDSPRMRTLIPLWPGANFHERETYEMLGVIFEGHPKLEKLLLPEDWNDLPPLRKDFHLRGRSD